MTRPFTFTGRIRSVMHALRGIGTMLKSQHNAWVHAAATVAVCAAGLACGLSRAEWCWIVLAVVAVWTAEALNTAFELLADAASPEYHPLVREAKDVAAGAVLITAIGSVIIGLLVFGPHLAQALAGWRAAPGAM
ncbi:MAG: diacylglycerol kinase family protein [Candidatus Hydrogenedentes bacterium]|nr:diacylglycerol kinase family protein [Candidatus Hydrogenedentota bacterium]